MISATSLIPNFKTFVKLLCAATRITFEAFFTDAKPHFSLPVCPQYGTLTYERPHTLAASRRVLRPCRQRWRNTLLAPDDLPSPPSLENPPGVLASTHRRPTAAPRSLPNCRQAGGRGRTALLPRFGGCGPGAWPQTPGLERRRQAGEDHPGHDLICQVSGKIRCHAL